MRRVNLWLALRQGAVDALKDRWTWERDERAGLSNFDYYGPVPEWVSSWFSRYATGSSRLFPVDRVWFSQGGVFRRWHLFNVNVKVSDDEAKEAREALDQMLELWPGQIRVLGAWDHKTGRRLRAYPLDPRLSFFMPDGDPTLRDVNLMAGQAPRDFS